MSEKKVPFWQGKEDGGERAEGAEEGKRQDRLTDRQIDRQTDRLLKFLT